MNEIQKVDPNFQYPDEALKILINKNQFIKNKFESLPLDAPKNDQVKLAFLFLFLENN